MKVFFGIKTIAIQKLIFAGLIMVSLVQCGSKSSPVQQETAVFFESKNKQYKAKLVFEGKIKALEPLSGELQVESSNGAPITSLVVETFVPTMPSMGHGTDNSRLSFEPNSQSSNAVKIKGIWFNMGGPWEISVGAKVNGTSDIVLINVEVP
jgi:hypothetical protein